MSASFQTALLACPEQGSCAIALALDMRAVSTLAVDLAQDMELGKLDFIQSVYIDNADNSVVVDLVFSGVPGAGTYRVRALPQSQGWYPVSVPKGPVRLNVLSNAGAIINVQFANQAMPYFYEAPTPGITVVPPLTNIALAPLNFVGAGSQALVAGIAAQTVKLYRGIFEADTPVVLLFQDGNGGTTLFSASLTAGGAIAFQVSGVPWFNSSAGNGLFLHASAACNIYGGFGYVQS